MLSTEKKITPQENAHVLIGFGLNDDVLKLASGKFLKQLEVVRYLSKRRCVCRAVWQEKQPVYAKLYFGVNAEHYAARDVAGVSYLQDAKIATPNILYQGRTLNPNCHAVVFEAIEPADNAENVWSGLNDKKRFELAKRLVQVVAEHHAADLVQTDLYLKNFLVSGDKIYTIDGDGIRQLSALSRQKALANLSVLFSKFDVLLLAQHLPALLNIYAESRVWDEPPNLVQMKVSINSARRKATYAYADKKVFRQCTGVNIIKNANVWTAIRSVYSDSIIPITPTQADDYCLPDNILKSGNTCTVVLAKIDELSIVIKRYNIKNFWHRLGRALRKTRASVSWANAHRLQLLDIATANPIALIEARQFGFRGKAYFIAEYIDAPDIRTFFKQTSDKTLRAQAIKALAQLFYRLYCLNIAHGDMKASNIKMLGTQPFLIDLDSMRQYRYAYFASKAHGRDLRRFMQNWKDEPSLYNGFIKAFKVIYADHAPLLVANILK